MNSKPLNAAYEVMNSEELAAAAYAHAENELESMRIKAAIPRKTYSMLDAKFVDALQSIYTVGHLWTSDYWRLKFLYATDFGRMVYAKTKGDDKSADQYLESIVGIKETIAAHFEALKEVCSAHGINYKTVLERNGVAENTKKVAEGVDLEYKTNLIEGLGTLLAGNEKA